MTEPPSDFAYRLRSLREAQQLSVRELADLVGVSKVTIWKWEKGESEPRTRLISPLAKALDVSPVQLRPSASAARVPLEQAEGTKQVKAETLVDVIAKAKQLIAEASGVGPKNITISIEY